MASDLLTDGDRALRPAADARNPWLREALEAEGDPPPGAPLVGRTAADVAIIGGGYTGLWTALALVERDPELRVVVCEADICGGGPSGRNGGFVNAWWDELGTLRELYGADGALAVRARMRRPAVLERARAGPAPPRAAHAAGASRARCG